METTVSALLATPRCDAGIEPVDLRRLDLPKVLAESWKSYEKGRAGTQAEDGVGGGGERGR